MRAPKTIMPVAALVAALTLAACGSSTPTGGADPTPSNPAPVTHTEDEWTVTTPDGWTRRDITKDADAKKAIRYEKDGLYVIVAIDPTGSGISSDAVWTYEVKGSGFVIVEKEECTAAPSEGCDTTDDRYDVFVKAKGSDEPPTVGGHTYYFLLGNEKGTTIDAASLQAIVESVRVR